MSIEERLASIETRLDYIGATLGEIKESLRHYVTHAEFRPMRNGFYGIIAAVMLAVLAAASKALLK